MTGLLERLFITNLLLLTILLATTAVSAHPLSVSYSSFTQEQKQLLAVYRLPMDDMDLLLRLDQDIDGVVTEDELQRATAAVEGYLQEWTEVAVNGNRLAGELQQLDIWQDNSAFPYVQARFSYASASNIYKIDVSVNVLTHLYQDHRNLAEFRLGDQREEHIFYRGNSWSGAREMERSWGTAWQFIQLGIDHIFSGYDHILFLLGLLLVASGIRNLVFIITSFTIAHSLTLALSTFGIIQPSGQIVEIIVAFSIAYVGLENLVVKKVHYRWVLTFLFGLAHGFGFATVLQNMELEREGLLLGLLTFNLGVEIGQLIIVAVFWPLLQQLAKSGYRLLIVRIVSGIILIFGTLWLVERLIWF